MEQVPFLATKEQQQQKPKYKYATTIEEDAATPHNTDKDIWAIILLERACRSFFNGDPRWRIVYASGGF